MTHGYIWLPLFLGEKTHYLFSEAWSDGYISGVGAATLLSTQNLKEVTELTAIFVGSPVFHNPIDNTYLIKEEDYLLEGYMDMGLDETLLQSAEHTLELINQGNITQAKQTEFAQLSLQEKLEMELGVNANLSTKEEAWKRFATIYESEEQYPVLNDNDAAKLVAETFFDNKKRNQASVNQFASTLYFWNGEQFVTIFESEKSKGAIIPLVLLVFLTESFLYSEKPTYWENYLSERDKESLRYLKALI